MSAVLRNLAQDHHPSPYNPISEAIKAAQMPVLPKQMATSSVTPAVRPRQASLNSSPTSPPNGSSPSLSPEDYASPSTAMSNSPPANPATGDPDNSQLPRRVTLPPRAKPGRKPATDTPVSKRKAQNREAQRNFRDRKRLREHEIQEQVRKREQEHLSYIRRIQEKHEREMKEMREQSNAAREQERRDIQSQLTEQSSALEIEQRRNEELNAKVQELLKQQNKPSKSEPKPSLAMRETNNKRKLSTPASPTSEPTSNGSPLKRQSRTTTERENIDAVIIKRASLEPQQDLNDPMEVDFTNMGKFLSQDNNPAPFSPLDTDESCGFCQANTYCACKGEMVNSGAPIVRGDSFIKLPKIIEPSAAPIGPGSCQDCLDDPERRRICLAMASRRQDTAAVPLRPRRSSPISSRKAGDSSKRLPYPAPHGINSPASSWQESHMTCTDAITYGKQHDPNFHENWTKPEFLRKLRVTQPHENHDGQTAQDVEIASIMAAMSASGDKSAAAPRTSDKASRSTVVDGIENED